MVNKLKLNKEIMEEKKQIIGLDPKDFNIIVGYLETKELPYKETKPVFDAINRAMLVNLNNKDDAKQKSDKDDKKGSEGG